MSHILLLKLPKVKGKEEERPKTCPYCGGEVLQRWGEVRKPVKDLKRRNVRVYRYRCTHCQRTFRHYPSGSTRADQTERLRLFAVLSWALGLSLRNVSLILSGVGVSLSHMTVWRNLQAEKERIERENQQRRVRILGLDGAYVQGWGKKRAVLVAVDMGEGKPVAVGYVNEHDAEAVRRWLDSLVQSLGVKVVVTDDLKTYRVVTKALGVKHQLCQFHVRRWIGRACVNLREKIPKEWEWVIDRAQTILKELPEDGAKQLFELWLQLPARRQRGEKYTPLDELRNLLIRMSESWERYTAFVGDADIPWTNNRTEQVIGRMKMRARTVRGYKSWEGMAAGLLLSGTKLT